MKLARILVAEDEPATRRYLCDALSAAGFSVVASESGHDAVRVLERETVDVVLSDHRMPGMTGLELLREIGEGRGVPVILYSAGASSEVVFRAGQLGATRFLEYPFRIEEQLLPTIRDALERGRRPQDAQRRGADRLIGASPAMRVVRSFVRRVAHAGVSVLITGETGTGKDVVARAIHEESGRERYFVLAIPELADSLVEAELFGHARGAFTGAHTARRGLFEEAHGGTLFLDEIGDAPASAQAKLLRVIESGEVRRVGANKSRPVDVRLLFATHRELSVAVREGRFRDDLFYRIGQVSIHLPPLREREEDIEPLARGFLRDLAGQAQLRPPEISEEFGSALRAQPWPGNAREVRAIMQRILLWWDGERVLEPVHLLEAMHPAFEGSRAPDAVERQRMLAALRRANGNQEAARRELGMTRAAWRHRWNRYGLHVLGRRRR